MITIEILEPRIGGYHIEDLSDWHEIKIPTIGEAMQASIAGFKAEMPTVQNFITCDNRSNAVMKYTPLRGKIYAFFDRIIGLLK